MQASSRLSQIPEATVIPRTEQILP